jgi:hypothetical protein
MAESKFGFRKDDTLMMHYYHLVLENIKNWGDLFMKRQATDAEKRIIIEKCLILIILYQFVAITIEQKEI